MTELSRQSYALCGACGSITRYDDWTSWNYDWEGEQVVPAPESDPGFYSRCPACREDLSDDGGGPGMWQGSLTDMVTERAQLVADNEDYPEYWADRWHELATEAVHDG